MAIGKKAKDIFTRTTKQPKPVVRPADISPEVAPRIMGRPKATERYQKVTVILYDRHVLMLDKIALAIREKTGQHVHRAELVRSIVDRAIAAGLDPAGADFDKAVRELLPSLSE